MTDRSLHGGSRPKNDLASVPLRDLTLSHVASSWNADPDECYLPILVTCATIEPATNRRQLFS